jgi:DNA (cytosine-5)-methyltransferase 1
VYGQAAERDKWGPAMGIDWMEPTELAEAIPPAFTELIGTQLMAHLKATVAT